MLTRGAYAGTSGSEVNPTSTTFIPTQESTAYNATFNATDKSEGLGSPLYDDIEERVNATNNNPPDEEPVGVTDSSPQYDRLVHH